MRSGDIARLRSEESPDLWPEIERRLALPEPRARRLLRPVPTIVAAGLLATILGLALFALSGLPRNRAISVGPGDVDRITVPEPQPLVAGEGAVWVVGGRTGEQALWRIDPATDQAQRVAGSEGAWWPAVGEGAAWVSTCRANDQTDCAEAHLLKIDPATGAVISSVRVPVFPFVVAAGAGSVWVSTGGSLLKVDPQTMSIVGTFPIRTNLLGIADGYLWATVQGNGGAGIAKIDPTTGRIIEQFGFHDPCTFTASDQLVAVASCQGGLPPGTGPDHLMGLDPATGDVRFDVPLSHFGQLAVVGGSLWIARLAENPERAEVQQIDPSTGRPTGVAASVSPGPTPWVSMGIGPGSVFVAATSDSFWLTHVDADDVVRVGLPEATGTTGPSAITSSPSIVTADMLRVTCAPGGPPRIATPVVTTRDDGVHVVVDDGAGSKAVIFRQPSRPWVRWSSGSNGLTGEFVSDIPPGQTYVSCLANGPSPATSSEAGPQPDEAAFRVADPADAWVSTDLACGFSDRWSFTTLTQEPTGGGLTPPEAAAPVGPPPRRSAQEPSSTSLVAGSKRLRGTLGMLQ